MLTAERLEEMEQLWAALCRSDDEVPSPSWHGDILADRKGRYDHSVPAGSKMAPPSE